MPADQIVNRIAKKSGNHHESIAERPASSEVPGDPQGSRRPGEHPVIVNQDNGIQVGGVFREVT